MTRTTRETLIKVSKILEEAGWNQPHESCEPAGKSRLFEDITDAEQAAFLLIVAVHLSAAEVAQQSGLSEAKIKTLFDSARDKLRKRAFESLHKSEHNQAI